MNTEMMKHELAKRLVIREVDWLLEYNHTILDTDVRMLAERIVSGMEEIFKE